MERKDEMVEKFICPGCLHGINIQCGKYELSALVGRCSAHVIDTHDQIKGYFMPGLPDGFNRVGMEMPELSNNDRMLVICWPLDSHMHLVWNNFNVPVWAKEEGGFLFVRTFRPRINRGSVDVVECGTVGMVPSAIDVSNFDDSEVM